MNTPMQEARKMTEAERAAVQEVIGRLNTTVNGPIEDRQAWGIAAALLETWLEHDESRAALPPPAPATGMSDEEIAEYLPSEPAYDCGTVPMYSAEQVIRVVRAILSAGEKK